MTHKREAGLKIHLIPLSKNLNMWQTIKHLFCQCNCHNLGYKGCGKCLNLNWKDRLEHKSEEIYNKIIENDL